MNTLPTRVRLHSLLPYGTAVGSTILIAAASHLLRSCLNPDYPGQISMLLMLLPVVITAWHGNLAAAAVAAFASFLSLEFFFIPPIYALDLWWNDLPNGSVFLGVSLAIAIVNTRRLRAERTLRHSELRLRSAREIQQRMYPDAAPVVEGFDIAGASRTAEETGGDYYDFVPLKHGALGIVVSDVSGHGFDTALLMAAIRFYLRALALTYDDPGELLTLTNKALSQDIEHSRFASAVLVRLNIETRAIRYAGAGHAAYLIHPGGSVEHMRSTSLLLGLEEKTVVPNGPDFRMTTGDILLMFSDGIQEALSPELALFGAQSAIKAVQDNADRSADEIIEAVFAAVDRFRRSGKTDDDMTLVVVKAR